VEQRQPVGQDVLAGPRPGVGERVEIRADGAARQHRALRRAGRAGRVHDQRGPLGVEAVDGQLTAALAGIGPQGRVRATDDDVRPAVGQHVLELGGAELRVDRHERDAGRQRGHDRHAGLEARVGPHGGALGAAQAAGQRGGGLAQLAIAERPVADRDGRLTVQLVDARQQGFRHPASVLRRESACRRA
jgi:hypothetical protein